MTVPSLPDALRAAARRHPDAPAIRLPGRDVTFAEVGRDSDRIAAALAAEGIGKGERVGLYCPNGDAFAVVYAGIVKAGAVVVPVNLLYSVEEVAYVLADAGIRALFYHDSLAEAVDRLRGRLNRAIGYVRIGEGGDDPTYAQWLASTAPAPEIAFDPAVDLAVILYTSGTTGHPKGAMLSHRNLVSNCRSVAVAMALRPGEDCLLVVLPMFHAFAATVGMLTSLTHGLAFVPLPRFDPVAVSNAIAEAGATVFLGVPSMYTVLLKLPDEQLAKWRSVRFCVSGGAAMPQAVMGRFEARFGVPVLEGDGPTECSPVTCVNPLDGERRPASVGLPVPGVEMAILDDRGRPLADGEIGEICVRGANVMRGYWRRPEATAEAFFGEWLRTGDLGSRDVDGYFYIVDRIKDMVIVNGMNVYPRMVEEVLYRHPGLAEAAVIGEPNPLHGEIPVAHLVAREGVAVTAAEVKAFCRQHLGRHEVPRKVVFRDALPKNAAGKILKRELRRQGELERGVDLAP